MNIYFIGPVGSDAGGWYIGSDGKIHRIPGWNPESMLELTAALSIIREAQQLKTPGLTETVVKGALEFAQREIATHLKGGGVLVVG